MCGIAGIIGPKVSNPILTTMGAALAKRGPDAHADCHWRLNGTRLSHNAADAHAHLLHARLSIRDPRPLADQPMLTPDGQIALVYNGEVYGWEQWIPELEAATGPFTTRSDTEFILRGYQAWGLDNLLPKLRGMFAFAILDWHSRQLHLVRDRVGIKPLLYSHCDDVFAFGSTVRSVLPALAPERRGFSATGIDAYLAHRYIPAPYTAFQHIHRLPNGHRLCYQLDTGQREISPYWQSSDTGPEADWVEMLDESLVLRTVADRPVGLFLSGGIDSTLMACRLAGAGYQNLTAFTARFAGSPLDESAFAADTAKALGLPHVMVDIPTTVADDFEQIVADLDEPFADPSALPTWYLARATTAQVKVVLGGDGGDELFAGYKRYTKHLRSAWRRDWALPGLPPGHSSGRMARWGDEIRQRWVDAYVLRFSGFSPAERRMLQGITSGLPPHHWRASHAHCATPLDQLLACDMANYLPEYILRKGDLCTMAHGLELRAPLLDHQWIQTLNRMPPSLRFTRPPKARLRPLCGTHTAPFARKKHGFNPPLIQWLGQDLTDRYPGLGARLADLTAGQIQAAPVDRVVQKFRAGHHKLAEPLFQLLVLDASLQQLRNTVTR